MPHGPASLSNNNRVDSNGDDQWNVDSGQIQDLNSVGSFEEERISL